MFSQHEFIIPAVVLGLVSLLLQSGWIKHRGPTHKYWFVLILNYHFIIGYLPEILVQVIPDFSGSAIPYILSGLSLGILTHLLLDSIYPWQKNAWV